MILEVESAKSFEQTSEALKKAIAKHGFGLLQLYPLKETLAKKGVNLEKETLVFEICQPNQAKALLEKDIRLSTLLPCRISLYVHEGKVTLATFKPTALIAPFKQPEVSKIAEEVEKSLLQIMNDASTL